MAAKKAEASKVEYPSVVGSTVTVTSGTGRSLSGTVYALRAQDGEVFLQVGDGLTWAEDVKVVGEGAWTVE